MTAGSKGVLVPVVGPSGVGKDSLIDGAARALSRDGRFHFPRRVITRPETAGGERHRALSPASFKTAEQNGAFCLSWRAHGLCYGVPASALEAVHTGGVAVVNLSRQAIADARARFPRVAIVHVTAPDHILAGRLAARGRETAEAVAARLARTVAFSSDAPDVIELANDGPLERGIVRLVDILLAQAERG
ncbi:MAG: phosphonate metabolism protein/1,5-bisphosphokinase (PRPP-forming) PhnN [Inquilinaceae bacterium]